ncbi:hypothetical protein D3C76_1455090 [compost metagenome]
MRIAGVDTAQDFPGQRLLVGEGAFAGGFEKHHQRAADALLGSNGSNGAYIVGQALGDVVSQLLGAGEEDVAGFTGHRLAAEQARELWVGEDPAKMFYGLVRPVVSVPDMFSGQL